MNTRVTQIQASRRPVYRRAVNNPAQRDAAPSDNSGLSRRIGKLPFLLVSGMLTILCIVFLVLVVGLHGPGSVPRAGDLIDYHPSGMSFISNTPSVGNNPENTFPVENNTNTTVPTVPEHNDDPNAPRIYLTFDDGPSRTSTPKILEILKKYDVHATFFVVGYMAEYYPDVIRAEASDGHVVANHGYSHNYNTVYASADAFMSDINACENVLRGILGAPPPRIIRFPAGSAATNLEKDPALRESIKQRLATNGWRYFDWSVSMGDSLLSPPEPGSLAYHLNIAIDAKVAAGATDIIVLAHDTDAKPWTAADLHLVIEHCLDQGYVFRTLSSDSPSYTFR